MNYAPLIRNHADYFDDLEDTDLFIYAEGMLSVPALQPTGNWRQDLRSYLANRAPRNGCKLRPRGKAVTGMGFALTLPKCVCILELLDIDPRIKAAVLKAAKVCLGLVELLAAPLQQKPDGTRRSQVVAFAAFQRLTDGSLPMPHRHVHLGVLSLALNDDARFQRVTSANLEVVAHAGDLLHSLFQDQVAWELRQLGYGIEREKESFTIAGFPENVMRGFCAGPRRRQGQKQDLRPAGTFQAMQDHWRSRLSAAEQLTLQGLRTQGVPGQSEPSFAGQLKTAAEQALEKDFFCAAGNIAAQALRANFGRPTPNPEVLARLVTGGPVDGLEALRFELDGQWCWGTPAGLAEERAFVDLIRASPLADKGWVSQDQADTWWGKQLAADRHRVALLRAVLKEAEYTQLKADLDSSTVLVEDLDSKSLRQLAPLYSDYLKSGRRVLFLSPVKAPRQSLWLNQLPAAAGVPVLWKNRPQRLNIPQAHGLNLTFGEGKAVEVFAARHVDQRSSYLIVRHTELATKNLEVRRLRAARPNQRRRPGIKRLALLPPEGEMAAGWRIQFAKNVGGFRSTELMTVLEVGEEQMRVERPGGAQALVSYELSDEYLVYQAGELELEVGDRIRLTRNNGDAVASGLRRGRRFVVEAVMPDGTAHLNGGKVLPPDAGHWEYDFCMVFTDEPPKGGVIVCEAEGLLWLKMHGWLRPGLEIVVCAPDLATAEQALARVFSKDHPYRYVADTDEVSVKLARAAVGGKIEVEAKPADDKVSTMAPAGATPVTRQPGNLDIGTI